eukprot:CAMPEP_0172765466 /NCGR_PEP_ID=MMETSP1074-20121228/179329_1 /TAXON_ID=2916 /ORGANISM="Ceratium fusus, Strain PA161109" /LENGTH=50 /DNA_ID=CAMNT_0013600413 /DNA_START=51 /DNA_END=199 /DNA_ORIENTATION=-
MAKPFGMEASDIGQLSTEALPAMLMAGVNMEQTEASGKLATSSLMVIAMP